MYLSNGRRIRPPPSARADVTPDTASEGPGGSQPRRGAGIHQEPSGSAGERLSEAQRKRRAELEALLEDDDDQLGSGKNPSRAGSCGRGPPAAGPSSCDANGDRRWDRLHRRVLLPPELRQPRPSQAAPQQSIGRDRDLPMGCGPAMAAAQGIGTAAVAEPLSDAAVQEGVAADELWDWEPAPPRRQGAPVAKRAAARQRRRTDGADGATSRALASRPQALLAADNEAEAHEALRLHDPDTGLAMQVPGYIGHHLRPYQREGVEFLFHRYAQGGGGILADDMGLGKTVQTVAFIAAVIHSREASGARPGPVLVIVPTSVVQNWVREFEQWTGGRITVATAHGRSKERALKDAEGGDAQVCLTTYETWKSLVADSRGTRIDKAKMLGMWHMVFFDEAHKLKNRKTEIYESAKEIATLRRYGLTGTVMSNDFSELFAIMDYMVPGSLGPDETSFRQYYPNVIKPGKEKRANEAQLKKATERQSELTALVHKYLLRRTKDNTIKDQLPTKVDNIVFCRMSGVQTRVYQRLLDSADFQLVIQASQPCDCGSALKRGDCCHWRLDREEGGILWPQQHCCTCDNEFHPFNNPKGCKRHKPEGCPPNPMYGRPCPYCIMFPCITLLQKVCNHLELLKADPGKPGIEEVQLDRDIEVAQLALGADADLVGGCFVDRSFESSSDPRHCGKMLVLRDLLRKWHSEGSSKVLLFSHSVRMLNILENMLKRYGYSYNRLDGSTSQQARQERVDEFNNSESSFVFLISTKAGGLGLNLTSANKVVVFDPHWNPSYDLQAQDRAFRIGQVRDVEVFRLVALGSLEEIVYQRQVYKQQQSNSIIDGTKEKRIFDGVQPEKNDFSSGGQAGDIWGLQNLLCLTAEKVRTKEFVQAQQVAEAQYRVMKFEADDSSIADTPEIRALGDVFSRADDMDAAELGEAVSAILETQARERRGCGARQEPQHAAGSAPIADRALLSEDAGVAYTLQHGALLGESDMERGLAQDIGAKAAPSPTSLRPKPSAPARTPPRAPAAGKGSNSRAGLIRRMGATSPLAIETASAYLGREADEGPGSKVLRALAAWQRVPIGAMAERLVQCTREERERLMAAYCEQCPRQQ